MDIDRVASEIDRRNLGMSTKLNEDTSISLDYRDSRSDHRKQINEPSD